jgi:hypothetical protein
MRLVTYRERRRRTVERIKRMRELNAPLIVVRNEQMIMWGLRQLYYHKRSSPISALPAYRANYRKFIEIHMHNRSVN